MPNAKTTTVRSAKTVAAKKAPAKKPVARKAVKKAAPKSAKIPARKTKKTTPVARPVKTAAELRKIAKAKQARVEALQEKFKPTRTVFTTANLYEHIASETGLTKRDVQNVWETMHALAMGAMMPRGVGEFTLPRLIKLVNKKIPAKKGGQKIMSFGKETISKAKPATVRVKARVLAQAKQVALPVVH